MILGIHCDVRSGYLSALRQVEALDCDAMQILTYRRHHEPPPEEFSEFRAAFLKSKVQRLILHVRYLPALASSDHLRRERSVELLSRELRFAGELKGDGLIFHMGAFSPDSTEDAGMTFFAEGVRIAVERAESNLPLILENVPGGGRRMGGALEELADMGERLQRFNIPLRYCLDTAHAWAFGYDMDTQDGMWRFLGRAHHLLGAENISVFHLNDSRAPQGSHRENHWHWGEGFLGEEGMRALFAREEFKGTVGILEMPPGRDRASLACVRAMAPKTP